MEVSAIYQQLGHLLAHAPNLRLVDENSQTPAETIGWLAKASALVEAMPGISLDGTRLQLAVDNLVKYNGRSPYPAQITMILTRVLAKAELSSPASAQGAFISAGGSFDAIAAVSKILSSAKTSVLFVDPYMDDKILGEFCVLVPEKIQIALLSDEASVKPSFEPALKRWVKQYGAARPIEARISAPRTLHDRLIFIDSGEAWILTQSLKDFAERSPATIQRADPELSSLKFSSYGSIWQTSSVITL